MRNLMIRLRAAWCAFWLIDFEVKYKPYHRTWTTRFDYECDNSRRVIKCPNKAKYGLEETWIRIKVEDVYAYIVCEKCEEHVLKHGEIPFEYELKS